MINNDRIVPITAIDLISMYATIFKLSHVGNNIDVIKANDTNGNFTINKPNMTGGNKMLNEPARSIDFTGASGSADFYFIPAYNYQGITKDGEVVEAGKNIIGDGKTLYRVIFSDSSITINQISV